jgi:hypothetical protein
MNNGRFFFYQKLHSFFLNQPTASTESPEEKERIQMAEYEKLVKEGKTGEMSAVELEQYTQDDLEDKTFDKFKNRIDSNPDQVSLKTSAFI